MIPLSEGLLGPCEKMGIPSNSNDWPQKVDETGLMASSVRIMEKPGSDQALKCPRCDSSNTKFCYYNNYSLSQPRHFCKACKRYWTKGGTLRNVPVGGGCRKNKRVKRSAPTTEASSSSQTTPPTPPPPPSRVDVSTASNHITSPLFYGLSGNPSDMNLPFPSFHPRVSNMESKPTSCAGYDLLPQLNALGLGFPSATMNADTHGDEYRTGFDPATQIQDVVTSTSLLSNYSSLLGSSSSTSTVSLLASSLQQQKLILGGLKERRPANNFQALLPFEDLQMDGNGDLGVVLKEVKMEEGNDRMNNKVDWNVPCQNTIEPIGSTADPSLYWNSTAVGAWPYLNNFGSSVTSLI
ncbi:PREDICTED: dof zinc finger protein DOF1.4-like [Nelumbo nucifera]|uniref:Dof zinc finger protein n=2 Tax=Nelumbo nucifera TaxID=4432 RepID=A0A1U8B7Y1_NELNU|nr:PREDICTED: dof zinc finger protein DOF1.4-like [Nelumbo nucifera]DAD20998.1 TPA_asm: hypothetical protein HUJ06_022461 [Nelumbo nucifera]